MDKLKLLDLGNDFIVEKKENGYNVRTINSDLEAHIDFLNTITYHLSGLYNNGSDSEEIDMENLLNLKEFCEIMVED